MNESFPELGASAQTAPTQVQPAIAPPVKAVKAQASISQDAPPKASMPQAAPQKVDPAQTASPWAEQAAVAKAAREASKSDGVEKRMATMAIRDVSIGYNC